jgi:hypothetical protein
MVKRDNVSEPTCMPISWRVVTACMVASPFHSCGTTFAQGWPESAAQFGALVGQYTRAYCQQNANEKCTGLAQIARLGPTL